MARSSRRSRTRSPRRRSSGPREASRARWPVLVAGLMLAAAALYALVGLRPDPSGEAIDEASRSRLESVLRDADE